MAASSVTMQKSTLQKPDRTGVDTKNPADSRWTAGPDYGRESGKTILKTVPFETSDSTLIDPSISFKILRTRSSPMPLPLPTGLVV